MSIDNNLESTKQEVLQFLTSHELMVLATVGQEHGPSVATVFYYMPEPFVFYILTKPQSEKALNMEQDPRVAFTVIDTDKEIKSIQIKGVATKVSDVSEHAKMIDTFAEKMIANTEFLPPLVRLPGDSTVCYKITATWVQWINMAASGDTPTARFTIEPQQ